MVYVARTWRVPISEKTTKGMVEKMSSVASSPWVAVFAAGATLANPGGFIPLALKAISEIGPTTAGYATAWLAFTLVSLLPLGVAIVLLLVSPGRAERVPRRLAHLAGGAPAPDRLRDHPAARTVPPAQRDLRAHGLKGEVAGVRHDESGYAASMRKKQLKRELRALARRHEQLEQTQRRLATHAEVIAVAVRSPDLVPQTDLDDAIAGIHRLNAASRES